jgi:hypothetical protein
MAVLSIDLAYRRWSDVGIVVLDRAHAAQPPSLALSPLGPAFPPSFIDVHNRADRRERMQTACGAIACEIILSEPDGEKNGPVDANILAGRLNHLCTVRDIRVILLDGPQAWKSGANGLLHSRVSERQLNTAAKTGLPGMVKPVTYRPFAEFCLDVYDALCRRGWRRLETRDHPGAAPERVLVESYPHAAWKSLGLKPLPSKRRCKVSDLAEAYASLKALIPFTTNRPPNHDQLQAIVGGLAGLALEERDTAATRIVGNPPRREDGHWREGFIVLPVPPPRPGNAARLNNMHWLD